MSKEKPLAEIKKAPGETFESATVEWHGKSYVVPGNRMMGLIREIETVITYHELIAQALAAKVKLTDLAEAWGAVLRFAGADATNEQVYFGMFSGGLAPDGVSGAISALLHLMTPPPAVARAVTAAWGSSPGNVAAPASL